MKDPHRIHRILNKLNRAWSAYPELRFNQLVSNITDKLLSPDGDKDSFYVSDSDFEIELDNFLKSNNIDSKW